MFGPAKTELGELEDARDMLSAFAKAKSRSATPVLVRSLDDVRLRPYLVEAFAEINDYRAKDPLLRVFTEERYVNLRPIEARTLAKLGARRDELLPPLARFAGLPDPMVEAVFIARDAKLLVPDRGARDWTLVTNPKAPISADAKIKFQKGGAARLLVVTHDSPSVGVTAAVNGVALGEGVLAAPSLTIFEVPGELRPGDVQLSVKSPSGVRVAWLVARSAEIPPPPPEAWPAKTNEPDPELPEIIPDAGL